MNYEEFKKKYGIALNAQQESAVRKVSGPVLLLAVPGSGKTTVLVARLGYMIHCCGIRPEEILTMTYTVAATEDMRARFALLFGSDCSQALEFRTINGISARIIQYYERTQKRAAFSLAGDESALSKLIGEIYREVTSDFAADSDIKSVRTLITYAKNMCLTEKEIDKLELDGIKFAAIYRKYCSALIERRWMDYDDQMVYAYKILRQYPEILENFQRKYRYLCVDEAQDTSKIQHRLIRLLAQKHRNLFLVGDEDQSIYGFRAAFPQALMEFDRVHPQASVLLMEKNYRSTRQIVHLADRFIRANQNRHPKHMTTDNGEGAPVRQIWVYDRKAQYAYLASLARDCRMETAVLYRDNDCVLPVIDILNRNGIGYRCRQLESTFFSHFIVRDISDIIRFAYDQTDMERFLQIYYKFGAGITKEAAYSAARQSRLARKPVLELLQESGALSQWSRVQVKGLQTHLTNLQKESAERAVYRIMHFMGYGDYLTKRSADQNKVQILAALAAPLQTPLELLTRLDELLGIVRDGSTDPGSSLLLSTIHSSKGLEYERVILMDVLDGILPRTVPEDPSAASREELDALEEERRLFYVAMTRAKRELLLFRYKNTNLVSGFAQAVFPESREPSAARPVRPQPKPTYRKPRDVSAAAGAFFPGTRILHRAFGPGVVENKNGTILSVRFDDGSGKRLDLITALRQDVLKLEG